MRIICRDFIQRNLTFCIAKAHCINTHIRTTCSSKWTNVYRVETNDRIPGNIFCMVSITFALEKSMVSAPCERALARRSSMQSIEKIRFAPRYLAHITASRPTGPAPLEKLILISVCIDRQLTRRTRPIFSRITYQIATVVSGPTPPKTLACQATIFMSNIRWMNQ